MRVPSNCHIQVMRGRGINQLTLQPADTSISWLFNQRGVIQVKFITADISAVRSTKEGRVRAVGVCISFDF